MQIEEVITKKQQKEFLNFRKKLYRDNAVYVDNFLFMLQELFARKTSFVNDKKIHAFQVSEEGKTVCQGIVVYAKALPEYIQLCFFESLPGRKEAAGRLLEKAVELGKQYQCKKLVIGLNGHVNYGLGLLCNRYEEKNSFSAAVNPAYYHELLGGEDCEKIYLNTYRTVADYNRLKRYGALLGKLERYYTYRTFDRKAFDTFAKIYTDLNNEAFKDHRYYYERTYREDREMLKELFLFMKEDSLIFAFHGEKPVGFVMWYPDFNELAGPGEAFGAKHFFKNLAVGRRITTGKIMEYGVLEEYRKSGLVIGLLDQVFKALQRHGIQNVKSSWILQENRDSDSVCRALCDEPHKRYVVYEKTI
ncbi:MAG: hypothetical protein E7294_05745 [Lachnospiraceae bacterium]|nr:hypothetical protein [Lachnospiraceae bacterium]